MWNTYYSTTSLNVILTTHKSNMNLHYTLKAHIKVQLIIKIVSSNTQQSWKDMQEPLKFQIQILKTMIMIQFESYDSTKNSMNSYLKLHLYNCWIIQLPHH
jgi:hypothetical protein